MCALGTALDAAIAQGVAGGQGAPVASLGATHGAALDAPHIAEAGILLQCE